MNNTVYATYLIPQSRFEAMEKAVKKLARKVESGKTAAEFPPMIEATREVVMVWEKGQRSFFSATKNYSPKAELVPYFWVTLKYARPVLNGWKLLAVYDWEVTEDGTRTCYTSKIPGEFLTPDQMDVEDGRCDHCNTNRRRNKSMLLTKDYLEFKVVGTTCIKDFLGHATPKSFVDCYNFEQEIERLSTDGSYAGGPSLAYYSAKTIMGYAAYFIRTEGYVKSGEVFSTVNQVREQFHPLRDTVLVAPSDEDILTADYAAQWVLDQNSHSDYIINLQKALEAGAVSPKRIALVTSAVYSYQRHLERVQAEALKPRLNEYLAPVGDKLKGKGVKATVERVRYTQGLYGPTSIVTLRTAQGHTLVWFSSSHLEPAVGEVWEITSGSVKKHDEYNGTCQTVLTRVKYKVAA